MATLAIANTPGWASKKKRGNPKVISKEELPDGQYTVGHSVCSIGHEGYDKREYQVQLSTILRLLYWPDVRDSSNEVYIFKFLGGLGSCDSPVRNWLVRCDMILPGSRTRQGKLSAPSKSEVLRCPYSRTCRGETFWDCSDFGAVISSAIGRPVG